MSTHRHVPDLSGVWLIKGELLQYDTPQSSVDLKNPTPFPPIIVDIKQKGRFFTYGIRDDPRLPKLGVFEAVFLGQGKFVGWKAHMVDTQMDSEFFLFNFTKIDKHNVVQRFEIIVTESGFETGNNEQKPKVELARGKRINDHSTGCRDCDC